MDRSHHEPVDNPLISETSNMLDTSDPTDCLCSCTQGNEIETAGWWMVRWTGVQQVFINLTYVFEHVHEAWSKAPGFVSVALEGADSHLGGALRGSSHHVDSVVHQSSFGLKEEHGLHHYPSVGIANAHVISHQGSQHTCMAPCFLAAYLLKKRNTTSANYMESNQTSNYNQLQWAQSRQQFYLKYLSDCTHNHKETWWMDEFYTQVWGKRGCD